MKKLDTLRCLAVCLGLLFAIGTVNAQAITGNNGPAQKLSDKAKQEMVEKNAPDTKKKEHYAQQNGYLMLPGFEYTGNKAVDKQNYQTAKANWIKNNPAEYRKAMQVDPSKRSGAIVTVAKQITGHGLD